jgi:hypothetical protein
LPPAGATRPAGGVKPKRILATSALWLKSLRKFTRAAFFIRIQISKTGLSQDCAMISCAILPLDFHGKTNIFLDSEPKRKEYP